MISYAAIAALFPTFPATAQQAEAANQSTVVDANDTAAGADAEKSTPGDAAKAHPDEDQAIVVTGVKRPTGDILGGV